VVISEILPMVELTILIEPTASWVRDLQRADAVDRTRFRRQFFGTLLTNSARPPFWQQWPPKSAELAFGALLSRLGHVEIRFELLRQ
jgi:hypothetical protein